MDWRCFVVLTVLCSSLTPFSLCQMWQPKADVVFVLDSSDTVGAERWGLLRTMLLRLVETWNIGLDGIQVSVVSYGSGPENEFFFKDAPSSQQLAEHLGKITFHGGTPDAGEAIRYAYRTSFSASNGGRVGVPRLIVHVSNGPSSNLDLLLQEAQRARNQGIAIFNIGIGQGMETDRLEQIASDPSSRYAFRVDSYSSLLNVVPSLSSRILNAVPVSSAELPSAQGCLAKADLVLLVDSSSSVGQEDFEHLEDFLKDLVMRLPVSPDQVQVGMAQFSSHPSLEFPLNMYRDRLSVLQAVDNVQFMGGGTNTGEAIEYVSSSVFSTRGGARHNVPRILLVVTDGNSVDGARTLAAANQARQNNIGLIAVGVGSSINNEELGNIAQDPHNVFQIGSYKNLQSLTATILNSACRVEAILTTTAPGVTASPCVDADNDCSSYDDSVCTSYASWAQQHCASRCGFCKAPKVNVPCENKVNNCESYGTDVCSGQYKTWATENCPRFCGFCGADSATLGFYNMCMYKGLQYAQNEKWVDGCDYECVCEDASSGSYRCYNRCPVYYDLPSSCTLVGAPGECCLKPVCDFRQELSVQEVAPGRKVNAQGIEVCEYQGLQYYQDQTWDVGCDFRCTCVDASRGFYRCQSYCPTYQILPSICRLTQKPGQCCQEPVCEFNTQTGSFTGFGTISGRGVETTLQSGKICEDVLVDCAHYGPDACTQYVSWARNNCAKFCGLCSLDTVAPAADDFCYYNGLKYSQSQTWNVGCDTQCTCEKAVYGYYRCVQSCPVYLNLPSGCNTVQKAGDCCQSVECEQGSYYSSATNIFTIGSGGGLYVKSGGQFVAAVPTFPSGGTVVPGTAIGTTGLQNIRIDGCLFHGRVYIQEQQWNEGCDLTCVCLDAGSGRFACRERCPKYEHVPSECTNIPDPNDPCCTIPSCPSSVNYVMLPAYSKSVQAIGAVMAPGLFALMSGTYTSRFTLRHSAFTVPPPTQPAFGLRPGGLDYCEYNGRHYSHGQTWEEGCDYNCVCEDAYTGSWRCVDKCEHYINVQPPCFLEQDPVQTCCQRPVCNFQIIHNEFQGNNTLPTTTQGHSQPACTYKGTQYLEGQSWFDGCSLKCRCNSADNNIYSCLARCPSYPENYQECPQVPDPSDPACCLLPVCTPTSETLLSPPTGVTPNMIPTPYPYRIPVVSPGTVTGGGETIGYCVYNGVHYSQDERWNDGCQYTCVCSDSNIGVYTCTGRCPRYVELPPACRLVTDFSDPCCQIPTCDGQYPAFEGSLSPGQSTITTAPPPYCVYNAARFYQGQTWQEGCSKVCRCEDAVNQIYTCTDRCAVYDVLPPDCRLSADPQDPCCLTPVCTTTSGQVPTPGTGGSSPIPVPGMIPTLAPGKLVGTVSFPTPTPGSGGKVPSINYCIYLGNPYAQGETWEDGCSYLCTCVDVSTGRYECTERCPRYAAIPSSCVMVRDAANPCCQRPVCSSDFYSPVPQVTQVPTAGSTQVPPTAQTPGTGDTASPQPGHSVTPTHGQTASPPAGGTTLGPTPSPQPTCVYKSSGYGQGQTWYDGCLYTCSCEDAQAGTYRCIDRCPKYPPLPEGCKLESDPADPLCCERPVCKFTPSAGNHSGFLVPSIPPAIYTGGIGTPTPTPGGTPQPSVGPNGSTLSTPVETPAPIQVCLYKGQEYTQGQKWADGCSFNCECVDAFRGIYRCTEKCVVYAAIPQQCVLVQDPNNVCCRIPYCDVNMPTPTPGTTVEPTPGSTRPLFVGIDGSTLVPPTRPETPGPDKKVCVYNGVAYSTGQSWDDACDLRCVCEDGEKGIYRCDQRCPTYPAMSNCVLVTDPQDSCCRVPSCEPVVPTTLSPNPQGGSEPTPGTTQVPVTDEFGSTVHPPLKPTLNPNVTPSRAPVLSPTAVPGKIVGQTVTERPPDNPNTSNVTTTENSCIYNGKSYSPGATWEKDCSYLCKCLDNAGHYECTERCPRYLSVPGYCTMVVDPRDSCCKTPLCSVPVVSTLTPTGTPTAEPPLTPTGVSTPLVPGTGPVPTGIIRVTQSPPPLGVCVYKSVYYIQGQQWYDGCEKVCVCDDASSGYYRCSDRCPKYTNVPSDCQMVASPVDPACCQVPQCLPTPGPQGYPTAWPGVSLPPTPTVYTNPPGVITGIAPTPTAAPGQLTPTPRAACMYNGQEYRQGVNWQDGCSYNCICLDETTGYYKCEERCPTYPMIPSQCDLIPNPTDYCCKKLICDWSKPTPNPFVAPTSVGTQIPNPNLHTTVSPPPRETTSQTPDLGLSPTPGYQLPTLSPKLTYCVYNGAPYRQGQSWYVGCEKVCFCDDSTKNYYTCTDRCPSYANLGPHCTLSVSANDACCRVPECYVVPTLEPGLNPSLSPNETPTPAPSKIPVGIPGIIIGQPDTTTTDTEKKGCTRFGVFYQPGQTWQEGCSYNCECLDNSGRFKCTERCAPYTNIPSYCILIVDSRDSCCRVPICPGVPTPSLITATPPVDILTQSPVPGFSTPSPAPGLSTLTPTPGVSTESPTPGNLLPKEVCVFKGQMYTQGQKWYSGCEASCVCEDAKTGFYRCSDRCAHFDDLSPECKLVPDPRDPSCCVQPECNGQNPGNVTGIIGVVSGYGTTPIPQPAASTIAPVPGSSTTPSPTPGPILFTAVPKPDVCSYKRRLYEQGQMWQDGCDFVCECVNGAEGQYRCTDRCPRYPQAITFSCTMVSSPTDPCCTVPDCQSTTTQNPLPQSTVSPPLNPTATPILVPGVNTPFPTLHPTVVPGIQFCVYKGIPYSHGQTWNDGCDKRCRCEDVVTGQVNCDDRCASFPQIGGNCQLVTDPNDACCRVPQCTAVNGTVVMSGVRGVINGNSLPPNFQGSLIRNNVCIYHGHTYNLGDVWDDGCTYTCTCVDSATGKYMCTEKCQRSPRVLPPTCMMVQDPDNKCCQKPYCLPYAEPTVRPDITPLFSGTPPSEASPSATPTPEPTPGPQQTCVYGGQMYRQGQIWYDSCNAVCRCENEATGAYSCQERCTQYTPPAGCIMVPSPADPSCCEVPQCPLVTPSPQPGVSPTPGLIPQIIGSGTIIGVGRVPTPMPTPAPVPGQTTGAPLPVTGPDGRTVIPTIPPTSGCLYKGVVYNQRQKWEDGCSYDCECLDDQTGKYACTEKCPVMPRIPQDRCVLVQDPSEPCCMQPFCDFVNPTPFPNGWPTPFPVEVPSAVPGQSTVSPPWHTTPGLPNVGNNTSESGYCLYKGVTYRHGAEWSDGCDQFCVCEDGITGLYTCKERCKNFGQLLPGCVFNVDPTDACCLVPDCTGGPPDLLTPSPLPSSSLAPGQSTAEPPTFILTGWKPATFTGTGTVGRPSSNFGFQTGYSNSCFYKRVQYAQNQLWEDGCDYLCTCLDAIRGKYQCTDRCPFYYYLPPSCVLEPDPLDSCCQRARCYLGGVTPTPRPLTPGSGTLTAGPYPGITGSGGVHAVSPGSTYGTHTGQSPIVPVTGVPGTGPSDIRSTVTLETAYPPGYTGLRTDVIVTGVTGGVTGVGSTVNIHSTYGEITGTGTPVIITGQAVTGSGHNSGNTGIGAVTGVITGTTAVCVHAGKVYKEGDTWEDGCEYTCTCVSGTTGLYSCEYRCQVFSGLPDYCQLVEDTESQCCKKPSCTYFNLEKNQTVNLVPEIGGLPTLSPTLEPSLQNVIPLGTHIVITGSSRPPGSGLSSMFGGRSSCIYKGQEYIPGETWDDKCEYTCTCIGEQNGLYRCLSKCPAYPAMPSYCTLSMVPGQCCPSLMCNIPNVGSYTPITELVPGPKPTQDPNGLYPTLNVDTNPQLVILPGRTNMTIGANLPGGGAPILLEYINKFGAITDRCIHDNRLYKQGESWNIDCQWTCTCMDSLLGFYKCVPRCATYAAQSLPSACSLVTSPSDTCCQTPSCPDTSGHQTTDIHILQQLYPIVGSFFGGFSGFRPDYSFVPVNSAIVGGTREGCVYKGTVHQVRETWDDGCDFTCQCIDESTGMYQCTAKCPTYTLLPPSLVLVSVQGECCPRVMNRADLPSTTEDTGCYDRIDNCRYYTRRACQGIYEGWARAHCPLYCGMCVPLSTTPEPPCVDKLSNCVDYHQESCLDPYLDWAYDNCRKFCNYCHGVPEASTTPTTSTIWTTPAGGCYDAISNCNEYTESVCGDPTYKTWVLQHCQKFCHVGQCDNSTTTPPGPCHDKLDNCEMYQQSVCQGVYAGWAKDNCPRYCNLCTSSGAPVSTAAIPASCKDTLSNCDQYGKSVCDDERYRSWASSNCAAFCNLCNETGTTEQVVLPVGWLVLMKGVSGVPGDLWQLWSGSGTANANILQAQYLTNQYRGHYKAPIVNQWDSCKFERIKVAIYTGGVEKGNIVFNAVNSGRNDWFRPENIISSTWNDLPKTASSFSMPGDVANGRQFAVGDFSGCQGNGWLMISTLNSCGYEQTGSAPRFLYSLASTAAQLGAGQLGEGDVFAIMGQGGLCMSGILATQNSFTGVEQYCVYKTKVYGQGDQWLDGCDYNCTCADASIGLYQCVDLCPKYTNVPAECHQVKQPDQCCAELICPGATEGCFYKGQTYAQGTKWQDGCSFDCACVDGPTGNYQCSSICPNWSPLPETCHLEDPAPGKCCHIPVCTGGMVIEYKDPR